jgi:hypothetical protein
LTIDRAPRRLKLVFQFFVFTTESLALRFRPPQVLTQPVDFAALLIDHLLGITSWSLVVALRHTPVMPNSRALYKREMRVSAH